MKPTSKQADIFVKSKRLSLFSSSYKPKTGIKIFSIVALGTAILFEGAFILAQHPHMTPSASITAAESAHDKDWASDNKSKANQTVINAMPNIAISEASITNPAPPPIFTPSFTMPSIATFTSTTPQTSQPNTQNIAGISAQIVATQQQIAAQMQTCINNGIQMANQITTLTNQQKQLQAQIDSLNTQSGNIDTSKSGGQQQQDAINNRIQQLQQMSDQLSNTINNATDTFNNANSQCQQNVSNLEQNRGQLESNLDDSFNNAMNIQLPD